mgnify:CR=1 FL=1
MHHAADHRIAGVLRDKDIPLLICRGLSAKEYCSERDLNDIDLFAPGEHFSSVASGGQEYVSKLATRYREEGRYLTYVLFKYKVITVKLSVQSFGRGFWLMYIPF